MSGVDGDTGYLVHTNLTGAYNCLELARRDGAFFVFLSTSRVYPVAPQVELELEEAETRFEIAAEQETPGVSPAGISERFRYRHGFRVGAYDQRLYRGGRRYEPPASGPQAFPQLARKRPQAIAPPFVTRD